MTECYERTRAERSVADPAALVVARTRLEARSISVHENVRERRAQGALHVAGRLWESDVDAEPRAPVGDGRGQRVGHELRSAVPGPPGDRGDIRLKCDAQVDLARGVRGQRHPPRQHAAAETIGGLR